MNQPPQELQLAVATGDLDVGALGEPGVLDHVRAAFRRRPPAGLPLRARHRKRRLAPVGSAPRSGYQPERVALAHATTVARMQSQTGSRRHDA